MNDFSKKYAEWALVTGASSGIGLEFAQQIAAKGLNVALLARSEDKLRTLAKSIEAENSAVKKALNDLGTARIGVPGAVNKFLYYSGKYLQPRRLNTAAFGYVFRNVLRNKLMDHGGDQHPRISGT